MNKLEEGVGKIGYGARSLELENFRNYETLACELAGGFNVIHGQNAQGKTNFLEALFLLSSTRLLRGMRDAEAVREGQAKAHVKAELQDSNTEIAVTLTPGIRKRALVNQMGLPRASDLIGRMPSIAISSADLPIIHGEPADRRLFLDFELSQLFPAYLRDLGLYKRALEQRNALLKGAQESIVSPLEFEPWEDQLANHGAALRACRLEFVQRLLPFAVNIHAELGEGEGLGLTYLAKDDHENEAEIRAALDRLRSADIARGSTSIGPHRDELQILVGGREARIFGSQGQQRTALLSLKLATLELATAELKGPPLLLLDDIFSDLDARRRHHLVDWVLHHAGQTVLTCTEAAQAGDRILESAKLMRVEAGVMSEG